MTFHREQVRREHKAREAAEDKIRKNKEKHEEQLRDASETFEREMAEQRARLEAKRDQLVCARRARIHKHTQTHTITQT